MRVEIGGRAYNLGGGDPDRTRRLARKVDQAITRFAETPGLSSDSYQLAVLAALHIADELATASDEHAGYRAKVDATVQRLLADLQSRVDGIEEEVQALRAMAAAPRPD